MLVNSLHRTALAALLALLCLNSIRMAQAADSREMNVKAKDRKFKNLMSWLQPLTCKKCEEEKEMKKKVLCKECICGFALPTTRVGMRKAIIKVIKKKMSEKNDDKKLFKYLKQILVFSDPDHTDMLDWLLYAILRSGLDIVNTVQTMLTHQYGPFQKRPESVTKAIQGLAETIAGQKKKAMIAKIISIFGGSTWLQNTAVLFLGSKGGIASMARKCGYYTEWILFVEKFQYMLEVRLVALKANGTFTDWEKRALKMNRRNSTGLGEKTPYMIQIWGLISSMSLFAWVAYFGYPYLTQIW